MTARRIRLTVLLAALLLGGAVSGCGGSSGSEPPHAADQTTSATEAPGTSPQVQALSASVTWPGGSDNFTLTACVSEAEHTILAAGNSDDGLWNLLLDANSLAAGATADDIGLLQVNENEDMTVEYTADVTDLTVQADGSFSGTGQDVGQEPFTVTGTCTVSW